MIGKPDLMIFEKILSFFEKTVFFGNFFFNYVCLPRTKDTVVTVV